MKAGKRLVGSILDSTDTLMGAEKEHSGTRAVRYFCVALAVCLFFGGAARLTAAPMEVGNLRLSVYGQVSNGYIIDSDRFRSITDPFVITAREYATRRATSAAHLFTVGGFAHLEYRLHSAISIGTHLGFDTASVHAFTVSDFRFPLLATVGFVIADWLTVQPELGLTINYAAIAWQTDANVEAGLRLRFFDRVDLYGGFIHGALSGFYVAASLRFFSIFERPLSGQSL